MTEKSHRTDLGISLIFDSRLVPKSHINQIYNNDYTKNKDKSLLRLHYEAYLCSIKIFI